MFKSSAAIALLSLLLVSCGGGGGDSDSTPTPTPTPNISPTVLAGDDQTVNENTLVTLTGSGTDSDGSISSYSWSQTAGTAVTITDADKSIMSFTAPETASSEVLTFTLTVTDNDGSTTSDTVDVTFQHVNKSPVASSLSVVSDLTTPYIQIQLVAVDADEDIISYVLESEFSGAGYSSAFIEEGNSILYITLDNTNDVNQTELSYRVTDGVDFSDEATVTIVFGEVSDSGTGANDASPEDYSKTPSAYYDGSNYSSDSGSNELPESVDLSNRMPSPGNQRNQGSCVGWAVGYALKSYQEGIEEQWPLITPNTQFSPAWIYNQINNGQDNGSLPSDALKLIVEKGAATLSTMPYSQYDFTSSPSPLAIYEASKFKAAGYQTINSIDAAKAALVNRQPIVIGLELYSSFYGLSGANSVYSSVGSKKGGHAVTITGYDDNKFGGSFKVINSWGLDFGDKGYFWLPYSEIHNVSQAYVLIDGNNDGSVDETPIPLAPTRTELANLQIDSWSIEYYGQAGGDGTLQFDVTNSGNTTVPEGVNIGLFLSKDESINSSDIYVAFEEVPFEIEAGTSVYRDDTNELSFNFPDNLEAGTYYMGLLVDDINEVVESNENDNILWGESTADIEAINLPDLSIDSWWLNWEANGDATLEYSVSNIGTAAISVIGWHTALVAHEQYDITKGYAHFLYSEPSISILEPNFRLYRDSFNPAVFNVLKDVTDTSLPVGAYYISLLVDPLNLVEESNDYNNSSMSYTKLDIVDAQSKSKNNIKSDKLVKSGRAFNGRKISPSKVATKKVEVVFNDKGQKVIKVLDDVVQAKSVSKYRKKPVELKLSIDKENNISKILTKKIESRNKRIFPTSSSKAMPKKVQ